MATMANVIIVWMIILRKVMRNIYIYVCMYLYIQDQSIMQITTPLKYIPGIQCENNLFTYSQARIVSLFPRLSRSLHSPCLPLSLVLWTLCAITSYKPFQPLLVKMCAK